MAGAETSIEWQDGATYSMFEVHSSGVYILTESNHCGVESDTIEVDFESPPPVFDLGEDMVICPGDTVILNAPQTDDMILWETSEGGVSTSSTTAVAQPGLVTLSISNNCGIASDEIVIAFNPDEPEVALDPVSLCEGESVVLDVTQPFDADYLWNTGSTSPILEVVETGDYHVSVMTDCYLAEGSVEVTEHDDCDPQVYIPNVFSPNGDNINDEWILYFSDPWIADIECRIFDRWGDLVFETTSIRVEWNGEFNDQSVLPGVYVYVLRLNYADAETKIISGDITLIR